MAAQVRANENFSPAQAEVQFKKIFDSTNYITVDFQQTVYKALRKRKTTRSGIAYFARPSSFRWDFYSKAQGGEEFYFNGKILTHFQEKEKLVTHYRADTGIAKELTDIVQLVLDPSALFNRYRITKARYKKDAKSPLLQVTLEPRSALAIDIDSIQVDAALDQKYIQKIKIVYMNKNYTKFDFYSPRFDRNSPALFTFNKKGQFTVRKRN